MPNALYRVVWRTPDYPGSDNGGEFVNKLVDALFTSFGIHRNLTTAYHPRSNGAVERLNRTLLGALSKMAHAQPLEWPTFLNYVLMAYRTTPHPGILGGTTTPFELVFGRPPNPMIDYATSLSVESSLVQSLLERTHQIRRMVEISIPLAVQRQSLVRDRQRAVQDAAHADQLQPPLTKNTVVYVENHIRQNKVSGHPRFLGPYRIATVLGDPPVNYRLVDPAGKVLRRAYVPDELRSVAHLNGLKIWQQACQLDSVGDIIYDADRVLDHRTNPSTKRREYLIRWSGFPADFDSWQSEQSIRDTPLLSEYWGLQQIADSETPATSSVWFLAPPPISGRDPARQPDQHSATGVRPGIPRNQSDPTVGAGAPHLSPPSPHALFAAAFACCCIVCLRRGGVGAVPLFEDPSEHCQSRGVSDNNPFRARE